MNITDAEIAQAVHRYCLRAFSEDLTMDPTFSFSERHISAMSKILAKADRKRESKRILTHIAIYAAAVLLIFAAVCISSPKVWAAVRNWYVYTIGPDQTVFEFEHTKHDYAFLVARPAALPDGMALVSIDEGDGYSVQRYEDRTSGKYLNFSYHWLTVRERRTIEKLSDKYQSVNLEMGYSPLFYSENGVNKMVWYDTYSLIGYWVESNLGMEELIEAFDNMELHPPVYVPTWLPEGYELIDSYYDSANCDIVYSNAAGDIIMISISDYGWTTKSFVNGEGVRKDVSVNNMEGVICTGGGPFQGTVLILLDDVNNTVITVSSGLVDPGLVLRIGENLTKTNVGRNNR